MSFGFKKRKRIAPGLFLNLSKRGAGVSVGRRGASVSRSPSGRRRALPRLERAVLAQAAVEP